MGTKHWIIVGGVLILALTGTLGLISHERLSRQEALDAAAVTEGAGQRVEAKLMHFSDVTRANSGAWIPVWTNENPIRDDELVWVIAMSGYLFSASCGPPEPGVVFRCTPSSTLLVVRDRRSDLPPPKEGQGGTRASIIRVSYTDDWPPFFRDLPDLEFAAVLL